MSIHPRSLIPGTLGESAAALVAMAEPVARFSLRARAAGRQAVASALDIALPDRIGEVSGEAGGRQALCLGPDEWLIVAPENDAEAIMGARIDAPHSLVEITDREVTVQITGPRATELLTLGWPRDPGSVAVGSARRTVFDGVSVVLWRDGPDAWRMDIWRSFAPHAISLLQTGCAELAAG